MHLLIYAAERDSTTAAILARAAAAAADRCTVVRVRHGSLGARLDRARGLLRKVRRRGPRWVAGKLRWRPIEQRLRRELEREVDAGLAAHPLARAPLPGAVHFVDRVNGAEAAALIARLAPDVILQNGAGLLAEPIFTIPRLGTWNLHHGYLPTIRGGDSVLWALLEGRPEWVGCSLHVIDAGIDTGPLLARARVEFAPGEHPGRIFARLTARGAELLGEALAVARADDRIPLLGGATEGRGVYRSMVDGEQLAALWRRGFRADPQEARR